MPVLSVRDLHVRIGNAHILRGVSLEVEAGKTLGVVGESGCGKSMTAYAVMGMLPSNATIEPGSIQLEGRELTDIPRKDWLDIRGQDIAMVMQDPFTSLNPIMRIGDQIAEVLTLHQGVGKRDAWSRAIEMLDKVGVPDPESSARKYPHQMSGGQRQRVVIAIAFVAKPKLLIADEPTTALDVTLQAQILHLLKDMQKEENTAVLFISHDIGVIGAISDDVAVYYAGQVVEKGTTEQVLRSPGHPYTQALLKSIPDPSKKVLESIGGQPPALDEPIEGCPFKPRCSHAHERCNEAPALFDMPEVGHRSACWLVEEEAVALSPE